MRVFSRNSPYEMRFAGCPSPMSNRTSLSTPGPEKCFDWLPPYEGDTRRTFLLSTQKNLNVRLNFLNFIRSRGDKGTMQKTARLKKIARHLLATTCLTAAAAGMAQASTVNESTDFSNLFATADALPAGTDLVNGTLGGPDGNDFFKFTGLLGGSVFNLTASATSAPFFPGILLFDSAQNQIGTEQFFQLGENAGASNVVPLDGILVVQVTGNEGTGSYSVSLDAGTAATPEPATVTGVGLGLAGALALRRRKNA
jgi:hypothetical protein